MNVDTNNLISVTDASSQGVSKLVSDAEQGRPRVFLRNNKPVAMMVDMQTAERLERLDELEDDLRLLTIALIRVATTSGRTYTLEEVMAEAGITQEELDAMPDED
jgi:hypothetical protein